MVWCVRLLCFVLHGHRSVEQLEFEAGPFTVLFGKNNAGKTNILETIVSIFVPGANGIIRRTHAERVSSPDGAVVAQLEPGTPFDDALVAAASQEAAPWDGTVSFVREGVVSGDIREYKDPDIGIVMPGSWDGRIVAAPDLHVLFLDWHFDNLHERVEAAIAALALTGMRLYRRGWPWLEMADTPDGFVYRVPADVEARLRQFSSLASDLLPDFVDGSIGAHVTAATLWGDMPKVLLEYNQRGQTQCADLIDAAGHGAARWMSAAVQIALHLMQENDDIVTLRDLAPGSLSGHILLIDEPEAHLHPSAVASVVRWCHRMVRHGFTIIVASHHEEFLRTAGNGVTLVHVTRDADLVNSWARALPTAATARLQELAADVGMHPAVALSLHRAVLFVEGPLDEAVLDEYAGPRLDATGVKILPIHGTKNIEGIVTAEVVTELGIKVGILTDATDIATMADRPNKRRSSEEKKVLRVLEIAHNKGLPQPTAFGIPEQDLLFALPLDGIREYLRGQFPGWTELVAECRGALGKSPSDSVDWKSYALEHYNLPINTPDGVRHIVRGLETAKAMMPSIETVVQQVIEWANGQTPETER
jgi:Overcoming lysogenization defect protein-like, TOPRIM domain